MCLEHKDIEPWSCDAEIFIMVFGWICLFLSWRPFYLNKATPTPASMSISSCLKWSPGFPIWRNVLQFKERLHVAGRDG